MGKKRVAVLVGGIGNEREISLKTGAAFIKSVERLGYPFEVVDCGPDLPSVLAQKQFDCALIALHGKYGEDGTVQGILEYLKIPYTGSGVLASALAMNKAATKRLLAQSGVPTAPFQEINLRHTPIKAVRGILYEELEFPLVVKPNQEGSAIGVSIVKEEKQFTPAIEEAAKCGPDVLVEKYIDGMEITVPIWFGKVLPIIEIIPKGEFYDFERKYTPGQSEHILPARLTKQVKELCEIIAESAFNAIGCRHYARVDMRIDKRGSPFVLEINTLPGCTETSLFPESAAKVGIDFDTVTKMLIDNAALDYA